VGSMLDYCGWWMNGPTFGRRSVRQHTVSPEGRAGNASITMSSRPRDCRRAIPPVQYPNRACGPVIIPCNILTGNYPDKKVPIPDTPGYPFTTALNISLMFFVWSVILYILIEFAIEYKLNVILDSLPFFITLIVLTSFVYFAFDMFYL
jgi:hypothetical protein